MADVGLTMPSYSYTGSPGTFVQFPKAFRFGGRPRSSQDTNISLLTDGGVPFVYPLFRRRIIEITFRVSLTDLQDLRDLHDNVDGETFPFYFSLTGGVSPSDAIKVRKEPGFDPVELDQPGTDQTTGDSQPYFDYTLKMVEDLS